MALPQANLPSIKPFYGNLNATTKQAINGNTTLLKATSTHFKTFLCAILSNSAGQDLYLQLHDTANPGLASVPIAFVKVADDTTGYLETLGGIPNTNAMCVVVSTTASTYTPPVALIDALLLVTYAQ